MEEWFIYVASSVTGRNPFLHVLISYKTADIVFRHDRSTGDSWIDLVVEGTEIGAYTLSTSEGYIIGSDVFSTVFPSYRNKGQEPNDVRIYLKDKHAVHDMYSISHDPSRPHKPLLCWIYFRKYICLLYLFASQYNVDSWNPTLALNFVKIRG